MNRFNMGFILRDFGIFSLHISFASFRHVLFFFLIYGILWVAYSWCQLLILQRVRSVCIHSFIGPRSVFHSLFSTCIASHFVLWFFFLVCFVFRMLKIQWTIFLFWFKGFLNVPITIVRNERIERTHSHITHRCRWKQMRTYSRLRPFALWLSFFIFHSWIEVYWKIYITLVRISKMKQ